MYLCNNFHSSLLVNVLSTSHKILKWSVYVKAATMHVIHDIINIGCVANKLNDFYISSCWTVFGTFRKICNPSLTKHTVEIACRSLYSSIVLCCILSLEWPYNWHDGVSNHQSRHCLLNRLFRRRSKKISKLRVNCLSGNSLVTGEFPTQMASNAENVSIWLRHHVVKNACGSRFVMFVLNLINSGSIVMRWRIRWLQWLWSLETMIHETSKMAHGVACYGCA